MKLYKKIIIVITGIAILVTGILCKQEFFLMIPLFISLFVMAFQSEANRLGPLMGSMNSLLYAACYIYMGVYLSAVQALLLAFPIQLVTFFRWKKNAYKKTAVFKKMSAKTRIVFLVGVLALWATLAGVCYYLNYEYAILDSILFLLGVIVQILTMLAYIEYTYLWIIQAVIGLFLNVQMVFVNPKETTYLVYGVYALYCVIGAFISVQKFYKEQQQEKAAISE